jgi:hypothetical protein
MRIFRREFRLVWIGLIATAISLVFGFTAFHWWIEKRLWRVEEQYYPEIVWIFVALPMSLAIVLGGLVYAWIVLDPFRSSDAK